MTHARIVPAPGLPRFTAILDDVYQNNRYLAAMGEPFPIAVEDIKVQLGLAQLFGDILVAPARFVVDHLPFIALCRSQEWRTLAFSRLSPAAEEDDWQVFLANCGGTETEPPLEMSSDADGSLNRHVREAWDDGRGWRNSQVLWKEAFPDAVWLIEELHASNVQLRPLGPRAAYSTFLRDRLQSSRRARQTRAQLLRQHGRYAALETILKAGSRLSSDVRGDLTLAAISAKHDETLARLPDVISIGTPLDSCCNLPAPTVASELRLTDEVPILGELLTASVGADALSKVYDNSSFATAQQRWIGLRRSGVSPETVDFEDALRSLCKEASFVLRGHRAARDAACAFGIGSAALFAAASDPLEWKLRLLVGGVVLLAASAAREGSRGWRLLHYDRSLRSELIRISRGRY